MSWNESWNRRRIVPLAGVVLVAVTAVLGWWLLRPAPEGAEAIRGAAGVARPNVILLTIDTLRADHLGAYGAADVSTPAIDRLAREGTRFTNAATTVPFTLPAHSSIMTGTYPPVHGVRENVGYALGDDAPTLATLLGSAGYRTAGFVSAFVLDSQWGIGRGFDRYHDDFDTSAMESRNLGSVQRDGAETLESVVAWLDERPEGPFFLWMHLFDPHDPYEPVEPWASRYPGRPYAGEVAYTDSIVGRFREALEERGLLEDSVVILTADHGEGLGDHGEAYHGYFIYESTTHVPLIVRAPGVAAGREVAAAVSHVDLLPTILEVTGIEPQQQAQGRSLVPLLLAGESEEASAERIAYTESYYALLHYGWAPLRSLRMGSYKYIEAPREELYELITDPREQDNVAPQRAATSVRLGERLDELVAQMELGADEVRSAPDLDEDTLRQLRALGYIAGRGSVDIAGDHRTRADPKDKIELHRLIMGAQSDIGRGDEDAAEAALLRVLERDPEILDANQMLGNIVGQRGDHAAALPYFQRALQIDPEHEPSLFGLATAYRLLGRTDEALVGYRRLLEINPTDSKTVLATADIHMERGRVVDATELLRGAVDAGQQVPPMLYNKYGEILVLQGRAERAEEWFRKAAEANPELGQPLFNLAVLREESGRLPQAVELYEEALERTPDHFQALFNLGRLMGILGRPERQLQLYERSIEANPEFVQGYVLLGKALMDLNRDLARAEQLVRDGLARDPDGDTGPLGWYVLADILARQGRRPEALEAARRGRELETTANGS